jgi:hypothetical protein
LPTRILTDPGVVFGAETVIAALVVVVVEAEVGSGEVVHAVDVPVIVTNPA